MSDQQEAPVSRLFEFLILLALIVLTSAFLGYVMQGPTRARFILWFGAPFVLWVGLDYCKRHGVALVGIWPLGGGNVSEGESAEGAAEEPHDGSVSPRPRRTPRPAPSEGQAAIAAAREQARREPKGSVRHRLWELDPTAPVTLRGFETFATAIALGFERVDYAAETRADGAFFWVTVDHARSIGAALGGNLKVFALQFTCFEDTAPANFVAAVRAGVTLDEVTLSHRSGDEVTVQEARAMAEFITKVGAKTLHYWAGEYDEGALDVFAAVLEDLGNTTLVEVDICDVSLPEPEDKIVHSAIEAIAARNRARTA